jgi:hypothetical protein
MIEKRRKKGEIAGVGKRTNRPNGIDESTYEDASSPDMRAENALMCGRAQTNHRVEPIGSNINY